MGSTKNVVRDAKNPKKVLGIMVGGVLVETAYNCASRSFLKANVERNARTQARINRLCKEMQQGEGATELDRQLLVQELTLLYGEKSKNISRETLAKNIAAALDNLSFAFIVGAFAQQKIGENQAIKWTELVRQVVNQSAELISSTRIGKIASENPISLGTVKLEDAIDQVSENQRLTEPDHPVSSIHIKGFEGKFHTNEGNEAAGFVLQIPEFVANRGEVVLITGNNGAGKSTFLNFLKTGNVKMTGGITVDGEETVDRLGDIAYCYSPDMRLESDTNILYQLTRKNRISELTEEERGNLEDVLNKLRFDEELVQRMETNTVAQISTGQKNSFLLAKILYQLRQLDSQKQVLIFDEVEKNLDSERKAIALKCIRNYCRKKGKIAILASHWGQSVDYADVRYHIDEERVMGEAALEPFETTGASVRTGDDDLPIIYF